MNFLLDLPLEILDIVVGYLPVEGVTALRLSNQLLNGHLTAKLWRHLEVDTSGEYCGAGQRTGEVHIGVQPHSLDMFTLALFNYHHNPAHQHLFKKALESVRKITFRLKYIPSIYSSVCASCALKDMIGPFSAHCTNLKEVELVAEYNDNEKACRWLDLISTAFPTVEKTIDMSACGWLESIPMARIAQSPQANVRHLSINAYGSNMREFLETSKLPSSVETLKLGSCITRTDPEKMKDFFSKATNLIELHVDRLVICPYVLSWVPQTVENLALICPSEIQLPPETHQKTTLPSIKALFVDTRTAKIFQNVSIPYLEELELYSGFKPDNSFSFDLYTFLLKHSPYLSHLNCSSSCATEIFSYIVTKLHTLTIHTAHCCDHSHDNLLQMLSKSNHTFNLSYK